MRILVKRRKKYISIRLRTVWRQREVAIEAKPMSRENIRHLEIKALRRRRKDGSLEDAVDVRN
jgi:autonomous glycyl radical cofactor GrcA